MHDEEVHAHDRDYERTIVAAPPYVNAALYEQRQHPDTGAGNAGINLPQEYAPTTASPASSEQVSNTESYTEQYSDHTHSYQEPPPRT
jgi:hypothetical protein